MDKIDLVYFFMKHAGFTPDEAIDFVDLDFFSASALYRKMKSEILKVAKDNLNQILDDVEHKKDVSD